MSLYFLFLNFRTVRYNKAAGALETWNCITVRYLRDTVNDCQINIQFIMNSISQQ